MTNFRILFVLLVAAVAAPVNAASLLPTLGRVLDGGEFDAQIDFVRTGVSGTATLANAGITTAGDDLIGILSFASVGSNIPSSTGPLGSGGYVAVLFSADVKTATNFGPSTSGFLQAEGNLGTLLSNVAGVGPTGAFAALLTSTSVDFATAGLAGINSSAVTLEALLDITSPSGEIGYGALQNGSDLDFFFQAALTAQPASLPTGLGFFDVAGGNDLVFGNNNSVGNIAAINGVTTAGTKSLGGSILAQLNPVPEPSSMLAVLGCLAGVGFVRRRRSESAAA
ncbi:hypothetical protein Pla52n_46620 [Stieleria varia]|uniref:PEP-CTERM protein-sorting domain-containing protein n=2 Tax=Stieleria varia TaxID=2528005 RepID=A0A5C6AP57_9BACT|nr:hypothetical protein Pla52n_46620 [Stieleria varia]